MKRVISKFLKVLGLAGGVFVLIFGSVNNFWRTIRMALNREN